MDDLAMPFQTDRSHIDIQAPMELKYWAKKFGVSKEEIRQAVGKVGSAAATVRKELGIGDDAS